MAQKTHGGNPADQNNPGTGRRLSEFGGMTLGEFDARMNLLGIRKGSQGYRFEFFHRSILFDGSDFKDLSGNSLPPKIKSVFSNYLLSGSIDPMERPGRLVTFREFPDAGPLFSRFVENTNKTIEQTFSRRLESLKHKCEALFSTPAGKSSYDLCVCFKALPKVPIILQFNDADDMLPANSSFLFQADAATYLELKSLAALCTYLTGLLLHDG